MLFINNKYTKWYNQMIKSAIENPPTGYTEKHHILPKSLGGEDTDENLVVLSARQHYVCHQLLVRMTKDDAQHKMAHAAWLFMIGNKQKHDYKITSRMYESAMRLRSKAVSKSTSARNKANWLDEEYRDRMTKVLQENMWTSEHWEDEDNRKRQSEMVKKLWDRPEYREAVTSVASTKWTDEKRQRQAAKIRALWQDPEYKARMLAARKNKRKDK